MKITTTPRRILVVIAIALASLVALSGTASAESSPAPYVCPTGYVCLFPSNSWQRPVLVAEGRSAQFDPALSVSRVTNRTRLDYCIGGNFSFGVPAGQDVLLPKPVMVSLVGPTRFCPTGTAEPELTLTH